MGFLVAIKLTLEEDGMACTNLHLPVPIPIFFKFFYFLEEYFKILFLNDKKWIFGIICCFRMQNMDFRSASEFKFLTP